MNLPLANISTYHILPVIPLYNAPYVNYAEFVHVYSFFYCGCCNTRNKIVAIDGNTKFQDGNG